MTVHPKRHLQPDVLMEHEVHWRRLDPDDVVDGRTGALLTVEHCARGLEFSAALAVADSALRSGDVLPQELTWLADRMTGRNAVAARRVLRAADGRADNPLESCLRAIALDVEAFHVQPQQMITGEDFFAMVDLADRRLRIVLEAEGFEHHGTREGLQRDCVRYTELAALGWVLLRFTYADVMGRPAWVRRMIEQTVQQRQVLLAA